MHCRILMGRLGYGSKEEGRRRRWGCDVGDVGDEVAVLVVE